MSQKLPVNGFQWVENTSPFHEDFIKNYNEDSEFGYFLTVDLKSFKQLVWSHTKLPFLLKKIVEN